MLGTRASSVASKGCDGMGNVRMGTQHGVHECAKGTLVKSGVDLREGELGEVFVSEGWSGNGAKVGFVETLEDIFYIPLLQECDCSCLMVTCYMYTQNPVDLTKISHLERAKPQEGQP